MNRIVVGYDGSEQALDALALARALRDASAAELAVAVVDAIEPLFGDVEAQTQTRDELFVDSFARATEALGDSNFTPQTGAGSPPGELERIATELGADAIVVGSTHRGRVGRVLPGSVGERLLSGSPTAVVIAPRGYAEREHPPFDLIGVGYDALAESKRALAFSVSLARELDASLRVITASPAIGELIPGRIAKTSPGYALALRDHFSEELHAAVAALPGDLDVEAVLSEGEPSAVLGEQSVELDLLVVGSRRYGPLRRVLAGSVSARVTGLAACPVLVAPRADAEGNGGSAVPGAHLEANS